MNVLNIDERMEICRKCPIYSPASGICNPNLYLNPDTNEISTTPKPGFIRGCNCFVKFKMKNPRLHCVAGKW